MIKFINNILNTTISYNTLFNPSYTYEALTYSDMTYGDIILSDVRK